MNDSERGENDASHLWNRRLRQRALLIERINRLDDFDAKVNIMLEFMLPDKPFSSFIAAYVKGGAGCFRCLSGFSGGDGQGGGLVFGMDAQDWRDWDGFWGRMVARR